MDTLKEYPLINKGVALRILKVRAFHLWAEKNSLDDELLEKAGKEIGDGLVDASLGGTIFKKRVGTRHRGKRGSVRTIVAFKVDQKIIFLYAFEKKQRDNIKNNELKALKILGKSILKMSDQELLKRLKEGSLVEVKEGK